MKYAFLLIMMILLLSGHITAQTDCDLVPCVDVNVSWEDFDYEIGCQEGYDCLNENFELYQLALALELASSCAADDLHCRNEAFFRAIVAPIYDNPLAEAGFQRQPAAFMTESWQVFAQKDYEQALAILSAEGRYDTFQDYCLGLVYELLNRPEDALNEYTTMGKSFHPRPLVTYTQGLLYDRLGRTTEASFEAAWLTDYFTAFAPDLLPLVEPFTARYPLDTSRITHWNKYLISTKGYPYFIDLTRTAPIPVQLSRYDELDAILAVDLSTLRYRRSTGDVLDTYVLRQTEDHIYRYKFAEWMGSLDLWFEGELLWGQEELIVGEGGATQLFMLLPADQTVDPRVVFGEPACEGGVISRLRPGMYVGEMGYGSALRYVENPGDELDNTLYFDSGYRGDQDRDEAYAGVEIRVTDKNLCLDDELWWEVTDSRGNYGWRTENEGNEYRLDPVGGSSRLFYCPNAPQTRLLYQDEGRVLPGLGGNHLRVEPGVESALVGTMAEGDTFTVLQGPTCADNMAWWQVQYGDLTGWTAEGEGDTYWLEPIMPWASNE